MKVFIVTIGTRGDVQPYVALGQRLLARGHPVTLCTSASFESFITGHGLAYGYMNDRFMELVHSEAGRDAIENTTNAWQAIRTGFKLARQVTPLFRAMLEDSWRAAEKARPNLVIFHPKAYGGVPIAEKLGVPCLMALPMPLLVPTEEFPHLGFPEWGLGGWYNMLTFGLVRKIMKYQANRFNRPWRIEHQLPPPSRRQDVLHTTDGKPIPVLHFYSRHVVPPPADWPDSVKTTGYWFLEEEAQWTPSPELRRFLDAGDPPVYAGFGSMAGRNPQRLTRTVIQGFRKANVRGVLATGWGGIAPGDLPDTIFKLEAAPHGWLFPRMSAVIHHGGAGTTGAGLRAGRPTIICPFFGDQPFWGRRIHALGAGTRPIPQKKLTAENLSASIHEATTNPVIQQRARALGEAICREDGVANAVSFIEKRWGGV